MALTRGCNYYHMTSVGDAVTLPGIMIACNYHKASSPGDEAVLHEGDSGTDPEIVHLTVASAHENVSLTFPSGGVPFCSLYLGALDSGEVTVYIK